MKTQILPNWCKKLGLLLFIVASVLNGSFNFINNSFNRNEENGLLAILNAFSGGAISYGIDFIAILAMLIYMTSKEKIEDDYINKLRLESFQLTIITGLLVTIIIYILDKDLELTLDYFIFPLLWTYLTFFFIKRRVYL